jgi:exopolysaccharide biosynthesis polyprenyl glycosylphosphotransferase
MKRSELLFNVAAVPTDIVALLVAGIIAFYSRFRFSSYVGPVLFDLRISDFLLVIAKVIPVLLIIFALLGLYNLRTRRLFYELNRIFAGVSLGMLATIVLFFFNQQIFPSRFILLVAWIQSIVFVFIGRTFLKFMQKSIFARGYGLHRLVIIDGAGSASKAVEQMLKNQSHGYKVVAELEYSETIIKELTRLDDAGEIDEILQANQNLTADQNLRLVEFARNKGLQYSFVPNLFEVQRNVVEISNFEGVPVISLKNTPLDGWGKVIKRIADIILSLICIVITSPLFILVYIAIKLDSKGAAIYSAFRTGKGKEFKFYKFRTMFSHLSVGSEYGGAEAKLKLDELLLTSNERSGPLHKIKNDPRVTRTGRFLRKSKLDEIPQFFNVLKGDMSMVGPRPHLPEQVEKYRSTYGRTFSVNPGIFGLTQIAQAAWPTLPFEEEIRLDTSYIENWSLWLDIKILLKSLYMLLFGKASKEDF